MRAPSAQHRTYRLRTVAPPVGDRARTRTIRTMAPRKSSSWMRLRYEYTPFRRQGFRLRVHLRADLHVDVHLVPLCFRHVGAGGDLKHRERCQWKVHVSWCERRRWRWRRFRTDVKAARNAPTFSPPGPPRENIYARSGYEVSRLQSAAVSRQRRHRTVPARLIITDWCRVGSRAPARAVARRPYVRAKPARACEMPRFSTDWKRWISVRWLVVSSAILHSR